MHACLFAQLCPTLCDPMNCTLLGPAVHGILQARILEWVAMPSSRGSSRPRDQTQVFCNSCIAGRFLLPWSHWGICCKQNLRIAPDFLLSFTPHI